MGVTVGSVCRENGLRMAFAHPSTCRVEEQAWN